MTTPQSGILPESGSAALFLVLRVADAPGLARRAARTLATIPALTTAVAKLDPKAKLVSVVGFGPEFWGRLSPQARPAHLTGFRALQGTGLRAPATGGDAFVHVHSRRPDLNLEVGLRLRAALGDGGAVVEEVHGFRYLDGRDLTGFIDGTENPKGRERAPVALIGSEDRVFAGGSYVFTQRYVHDLARWAALPVREQEQAIGRRKRDSKEQARKAPTAHISRVVIEEDGEELEVVRQSMPYGTTSEAGLFFVLYTRDLRIPFRMLERMIGTTGDGYHDRLMEFTRAVSGATFFAPSLAGLKRLAAA